MKLEMYFNLELSSIFLLLFFQINMKRVPDSKLRDLWLDEKNHFSFSGSKSFQTGLMSELKIYAPISQIRRVLNSIPSFTTSVLRRKEKKTR